jgi:hypothetical protein
MFQQTLKDSYMLMKSLAVVVVIGEKVLKMFLQANRLSQGKVLGKYLLLNKQEYAL